MLLLLLERRRVAAPPYLRGYHVYPRLDTDARTRTLPAHASDGRMVVGRCNKMIVVPHTRTHTTMVMVVMVVMVGRRVGNYGERAFRRGRASVVVSEPREEPDLRQESVCARRPRFSRVRVPLR